MSKAFEPAYKNMNSSFSTPGRPSLIKSMKIVHGLILLLALGFLGGQILHAEEKPPTAPLWSKSANAKIKWFEVTPMGDIVVCTKKSLRGLNPDNGETEWVIREFANLAEDHFENIPETPLAMIISKSQARNSKEESLILNTNSGELFWQISYSGLKSTAGQFLVPRAGILLIYGIEAKKPNRPSLLALDLRTARVLWEQREMFGGFPPHEFPILGGEKAAMSIIGNQPPFWIGDSSVIVYLSQDGPKNINPHTGEILWAAFAKPGSIDTSSRRNRQFSSDRFLQGNRAPALKFGYPFMFHDVDEGVIYTAFDNSVSKINVESGEHLWTNLPHFNSIVTQLELTDAGIVVKSGYEDGANGIHLLDISSGEVVWKLEQPQISASPNFVLNDSMIILFESASMRQIDILTGVDSIIELSSEIKGINKRTSRFEIHPEGYWVLSGRSAGFVRFDGSVVSNFHSNYGNKSFMSQGFGLLVTAVRIAVVASALSRNNTGVAEIFIPRRPPSYFIEDNPTLSKRFENQDRKEYIYFPENVNFNELVDVWERRDATMTQISKISKESAEIVSQCIFGGKNQRYKLDRRSSRVYYIEDSDMIVCIEL